MSVKDWTNTVVKMVQNICKKLCRTIKNKSNKNICVMDDMCLLPSNNSFQSILDKMGQIYEKESINRMLLQFPCGHLSAQLLSVQVI